MGLEAQIGMLVLGLFLLALGYGFIRFIHRLEDKIDAHLRGTGEQLSQNNESLGQTMHRHSQIFGELNQKLGKIEHAGRHIQDLGEDISQLNEIFRSPKMRGNLGEQGLAEILENILPSTHFKMQYRFASGDIADALIFLASKKRVAIDSKFPLENFQRMQSTDYSANERKQFEKNFHRDIKKHIDAISQKYIRPSEGTLDFALMYIPAENLYYQSFLSAEMQSESLSLQQYAQSKRVIPVSPNSLFAYLQTILRGLRGMQMEERAKNMLNFVDTLQFDLDQLEAEFEKLGRHLQNAQQSFHRSQKNLHRTHSKIETVDSLERKPRIKEFNA